MAGSPSRLTRDLAAGFGHKPAGQGKMVKALGGVQRDRYPQGDCDAGCEKLNRSLKMAAGGIIDNKGYSRRGYGHRSVFLFDRMILFSS
jgi:hypothetical protein